MPRPRPEEPLINTAIRLPRSIHLRLTTEAARRDLSVNTVVTKAVTRWLDEKEGKELE